MSLTQLEDQSVETMVSELIAVDELRPKFAERFKPRDQVSPDLLSGKLTRKLLFSSFNA